MSGNHQDVSKAVMHLVGRCVRTNGDLCDILTVR